MSDFTPTQEQQAALDLFGRGESMVIEAGAGTGKTATLIMLAESTDAAGQYVAFNKSIVQEAERKLPDNVHANTAHSLAYKAVVGKDFRNRLRAPRMKPWQLANLLDVEKYVVRYGSQSKTLERGYLAGLVMKTITNFCNSGDLMPGTKHVPYIDGIDIPTAQGHRTYTNNDRIRDMLADPIAHAWADIQRPVGQLPFKHEHYLKIWQLSDPKIPVEFILLDEAQDANPVIAAIIDAQEHAQRVYVGDSQQQIYEFTGAVNAMAEFDTSHRTFLTQSFRFGHEIANTANLILAQIDGAELRLKGHPPIASTVGFIAEPSCVLARTNARTIEEILRAHEQGRTTHLVGGGGEIERFAQAASALMAGSSTSHPDLACFSTWGEVQDYVENDPQGSDLAGMVKLIDDHGVDVVLSVVANTTPEHEADMVVSTAHKSKGREWSSVRIASDFPIEIREDAERRLMYVAATRAQLALDDAGIRHHYTPKDEQ